MIDGIYAQYTRRIYAQYLVDAVYSELLIYAFYAKYDQIKPLIQFMANSPVCNHPAKEYYRETT